MATHFSIFAWRIPWTVHGVAELDTTQRILKEKKKRPVLLVSLSAVHTKQTAVSEMLSSSACKLLAFLFFY